MNKVGVSVYGRTSISYLNMSTIDCLKCEDRCISCGCSKNLYHS